MKFLFWNLNRLPLVELVKTIVTEHGIDVVALAENVTPITEILVTLNSDTDAPFIPALSPPDG